MSGGQSPRWVTQIFHGFTSPPVRRTSMNNYTIVRRTILQLRRKSQSALMHRFRASSRERFLFKVSIISLRFLREQSFDLSQMDLIEKSVQRTCWKQDEWDAPSTAVTSTIERSYVPSLSLLLLSLTKMFSRSIFSLRRFGAYFRFFCSAHSHALHKQIIFVSFFLSLTSELDRRTDSQWLCFNSQVTSHVLREKAENLIAHLQHDSDAFSFAEDARNDLSSKQPRHSAILQMR